MKRTQLLCVICTVCEQPVLSVMVRSCHACVNLSRLCSSGFTPTLRSAVVALHRRCSALGLSHARNYPRTFGLHEIFKCAHLLTASIHTHNFRNAVTLVWGSLGLAPRTIPPGQWVLRYNESLQNPCNDPLVWCTVKLDLLCNSSCIILYHNCACVV